MKVRICTIMLVLVVCICVLTCNDHSIENVEERPKDLTFGKYYEPYEPRIRPNALGYTLPLNINDIVNYDQVSYKLDLQSVQHLIEQNGFAVIEYDFEFMYQGSMTGPYTYLKDREIPFFVTTDTVLHLYHIQFNETLKDIEEREFASDVNDLTAALLNYALELYGQLNGDLKEAAKRNVAYLSVAQRLINPDSQIPKLVADVVARELAKIEAHQDFTTSDIFIYQEDYSQYVPRGHYDQNYILQQYFKAIMWYGRMAFLLKGGSGALISERDARIQTLQAVLLATSLKNVRIGDRTGLQVWDRLYTTTAFYIGLADDLTPYDYLWALDKVFGAGFVLSNLANEKNLSSLKRDLALLPSSKIHGGSGNIMLAGTITDESLNEILDKTKGMHMIGQRFTPDAYIFQHLIFPEVRDYLGNPTIQPFTLGSNGMGGLSRTYVRGLDLMALFGSSEAKQILIDEGDTNYEDYWNRFAELKSELDQLSLTDWNRNLYWSWLYTLRALLDEVPEGYPNFMRTKAWQRRQLNTALASWAQLRHDTILYTEQAYSAGGGIGVGRKKPPPPPPGYFEPLPVFWARLLALSRMTSRGLDDLNILSPEALKRFNRIEKLLQRTLDIVTKQLANKHLSLEDREFIKGLPWTLEGTITGLMPEGLKTTLAADVYTYALEEKIVEEAVGKVDLIVVACPMPEGMAFLAAGPTFSCYEFKHPMSDRLTDEAWRLLLDSLQKPQRPKWYVPLLRLCDNSPTNVYRSGLKRLTYNPAYDGNPCWSPDGKKIAFASDRDGNNEIYVMNADGSEPKNLTNSSSNDNHPCWSSDGKKIAFASDRDGNNEIYVMNINGSELKKLTNSPAIDWYPCWSPDGKKIAFVSDKGGNGEIHVMNADGSELKNLTNSPAHDWCPSWSPDGKKIAFVSDRDGKEEIYVMNTDGSELKNLTNSPAIDWEPCWSPDGKKIAFISDRDGYRDIYREIYVMNHDGSELKKLTNNRSSDGCPVWSPDGKKIVFMSFSDIDFNPDLYIMNTD